MSATPASYDDFVDETLDSFGEAVLARGQHYAAEGRVQVKETNESRLHAVVVGTQQYDVEVSHSKFGVSSYCTCRAFERENECKHIAALAFTLRPSALEKAKEAFEEETVPAVVRHVRLASSFFDWMGIGEAAFVNGAYVRYSPLAEWWAWMVRHSRQTRRPVPLFAEVRTIASAIEGELEALRKSDVPDVIDDGSAYAELRRALSDLFMAHRARATVVSVPPWSFSEIRGGAREPFSAAVEFDADRWTLRVRQPSQQASRPDRSMTIELTTPSRSVPEVRSDPNAGLSQPLTDAWHLVALRELCLVLHEGTDPVAQELATKLSAPSWEVILAHVEGQRTKAAPERQWSFLIREAYGNAIEVAAVARKIGKGGKLLRPTKTPLSALFDDEGASDLEQRIGSLLLAAGIHSNASRFELGTAQTHEILRLLADHPRVSFGYFDEEPEKDPDDDDDDDRPRIVTADLVVRLVETKGSEGGLVPRFFAGDVELDARTLDASKGAFYGIADPRSVLSVFVPRAARAWIGAAASRPKGFAFPKKATSRLVAALRPLAAAGHAEIPRNVLGTELPFEPIGAARVVWGPGPTASVEVLVRVHPAAPLVSGGMGAEAFTFVHEGNNVFVLRDFRKERAVIERLADALDAIAEPLGWSERTGTTNDADHTVALAQWLDANPLGIAIEVKRGTRPTIVPMSDVPGEVRASRRGAWLVLGGALDLQGTKITFGEVLEAARRARRFVEAKPGVFLELTEESRKKLATLAAATELAGSTPHELRIHHGLRGALEGASVALPFVSGLELSALADRLSDSGKKAKAKEPLDVDSLLEHGMLRAYQAEAVRWILALTEWAPGCVLADDMGLGKTVQTAAVLRARAELGPQLIVAPASVASNWMAELRRFVPSLKARFYNEESAGGLGKLGPNDVVVASYGVLLRRKAELKDATWTTVVVDEAQYVKNTTAQRTEAVRALTRDFTIALTGTPVENHLGELYSVVDCAVPGLLGHEMIFREVFRRPIEGRGDSGKLALLTKLLAPFVLRRTRASVLDDLPEREEITEYVDLSAAERKHYLALRKACEAALTKRRAGETQQQFRVAVLAALLRLRQLACDVRLVDDSFDGESTKIVRIVQLVTQIAEEGSRAIVFSQFTQFLDKIRDALAAAGLRVSYLSGDTPTAKRRDLIESFQRGEQDVFCVSLMAGGTGLNLTAASYVIHADPWWNPAVEEQATSRAHRMGQTEPVTVYRLVARGTIEEAVLQMHAAKRNLAEAVLAGQGDTTTITPSELLELVKFGG